MINGLAAAVSEVVVETRPVPVEKIGVMYQFGQTGTRDYLKRVYTLTIDDIVAAVRKVISRKK